MDQKWDMGLGTGHEAKILDETNIENQQRNIENQRLYGDKQADT